MVDLSPLLLGMLVLVGIGDFVIWLLRDGKRGKAREKEKSG